MVSSKNIRVIYSKDADHDLEKLENEIARRVVKKIAFHSADPMREAKPLKGEYQGYYRYRIGDYRAIFYIDDDGQVKVLMVLKVGHRNDVY